jgi:hypothetical protein
MIRTLLFLIAALPLLFCVLGAQKEATIYGEWLFNGEESTDIAPWGRKKPHLFIRDGGEVVTIIHDWRRGRQCWSDTLTVVPGGQPSVSVVSSPVWPQNWFMGVLAKVGSGVTTTAAWLEPQRRLRTETEQIVEVSQGEAAIVTIREYALDPEGGRLSVTENRSTRPTPIRLVFDRAAGEGGGIAP